MTSELLIEKLKHIGVEEWRLAAEKIEKELKALEIIKNKKVNVFNIFAFDDYTQYKEHYPFSEYNAREDMLTCGEFVLLKEELEGNAK